MSHICHHTLENLGNSEEILKSGPIIGTNKNNYFGIGYYFWDNNFKHAKWWGRKQYNNNYYVFEAEINFDMNLMFDVTDRNCLDFLLQITKIFLEEDNIDLSNYCLGALLTLLFEEEKMKNEIYFPYPYAKGIDANRDNNSERMNYSSITKSYFNFNPITFFCIFKKEDINLQSFKLL